MTHTCFATVSASHSRTHLLIFYKPFLETANNTLAIGERFVSPPKLSGLGLVNLCLDFDTAVSQKCAEVKAGCRVETSDVVTPGKLSRWRCKTQVVFMGFESSAVNCLGIRPGRVRLLQKGVKLIMTVVREGMAKLKPRVAQRETVLLCSGRSNDGG